MTLQPPPSLFQGVDPEIAARIDEFVQIRRDLHQRPELAFKETRTSGVIARLLAEWGYEVTTGIGKTGVVATLRRGAGPKALAIRADFDALPIREATGLPYASENSGVMHACGHDGHTTILLAAARRLAASGAFRGTLHLVFQPAEEIGAGASALIKDGLFERFPVDAIYGLHNWPNVPAGQFGFVTGPAMASVDRASVRVRGRGGHGAAPHEAVDPVVAAAHIVTALQTVVSRNVDPLDVGVVTVASIHGGEATNVIPEWVDLKLTTRSFRPEIRLLLQNRLSARLSVGRQPRRGDGAYRGGRARNLWRCEDRQGLQAPHSERGFRLLPGAAPGQLRVCWKRRRADAAQRELQFQRRHHWTRGDPLGASRGTFPLVNVEGRKRHG
jgi:hippurate hydrolase